MGNAGVKLRALLCSGHRCGVNNMQSSRKVHYHLECRLGGLICKGQKTIYQLFFQTGR